MKEKVRLDRNHVSSGITCPPLLAARGLDTGCSGQKCNSRSKVQLKISVCSWSCLPCPLNFITSARGEADGRRRWSAASSRACGCRRPSFSQPELPGPGSRRCGGRGQRCLMIHSNSLFIPLGTQKGGREQISTPQTQFRCTSAYPFRDPMSLLKGSMENLSE